MTKLFNRKYELIAGPAGGNGRLWNGLRIKFKVEKTGDSGPNKAEIELYNLNKDSREYIAKEDLAIILSAGYQNTYGQIFSGYTTFTHSQSVKGHERHDENIKAGFERRKKEDADWISKITAHDGLKALKHYIIISLADDKLTEIGVLNKVVDKLNESIKVPRGTIKGIRGDRINHGICYSATFKTILDRLCKNQGLQWKINNGTLNIYPKNEAVSEEIIQVDSESGLMGSPELTENGYKFTNLLRHEFEPGTPIYLKSQLVQVKAIIANVTHTGDTESDEWYSACEAIPA